MLSERTFICPIPVVDIERAKRFYGEVLGLPFVDESEAGALFEVAGGGRILLYVSPAGDRPTHTVAGWEVDSLEETIEALGSRGVRFEGYDLPGFRTENHVAWIGPERAAWFKDSEGNVIAISEPWVDRLQRT